MKGCVFNFTLESGGIFDEGLDGWAKRGSGQVFEDLPQTSCIRQPPVRSIVRA